MYWSANQAGKKLSSRYIFSIASVSNLISFTRYSIDICLLSCKRNNICNYFLPLKLSARCTVFVINNIQFLVVRVSEALVVAWTWRTEGFSEWPTEFWHFSHSDSDIILTTLLRTMPRYTGEDNDHASRPYYRGTEFLESQINPIVLSSSLW